ncbi:hypothetical protein FRB98_001740 [Tulasnella sp. 332]|nr:hypothetical protein FRB98_001740 [Tulasnella sp. 332]
MPTVSHDRNSLPVRSATILAPFSPTDAPSVARYSALVGGILYGISHRRTLMAEEHKHKAERAVHQREELIQQARKMWKEKQNPIKSSGIITNPEDPNFDLEKLIAKWEAESK